MSVFHPGSVRASLYRQLKEECGAALASSINDKWQQTFNSRTKAFKRTNSDCSLQQREFIAHACAYVDCMSLLVEKNKLPANSPLLGPRFIPPSYPFASLHHDTGIDPISYDSWTVRPVTLISFLYYPDLRCCPNCAAGKKETKLKGWGQQFITVHGIEYHEYAIGGIFICQGKCGKGKELMKARGEGGARAGGKKGRGKGKQREVDSMDVDEIDGSDGNRRRFPKVEFGLTAPDFWEQKHHHETPPMIPYVRERTAVTRSLFDFIAELRLSTPSSRLQEHLSQLQLKVYWKEVGSYYEEVLRQASINPSLPAPTSPPSFINSFFPITTPILDTVYKDFAITREEESEQFMRSLECHCVSFDHLVKIRNKMIVTESSGYHGKPIEGGICAGVNQDNLVVTWAVAFDTGSSLIADLIAKINTRNSVIKPERGTNTLKFAVVDNCCSVRPNIQTLLSLGLLLLLDFWHFQQRYAKTILLKTKNPNYIQRAVAGSLIMTIALCHDFVLRRNVRIAYRKNLSPFITLTQGSPHLLLVDSVLALKEKVYGTSVDRFPNVESGEKFGLLPENYGISGEYLSNVKLEEYEVPEDNEDDNFEVETRLLKRPSTSNEDEPAPNRQRHLGALIGEAAALSLGSSSTSNSSVTLTVQTQATTSTTDFRSITPAPARVVSTFIAQSATGSANLAPRPALTSSVAYLAEKVGRVPLTNDTTFTTDQWTCATDMFLRRNITPANLETIDWDEVASTFNLLQKERRSSIAMREVAQRYLRMRQKRTEEVAENEASLASGGRLLYKVKHRFWGPHMDAHRKFVETLPPGSSFVNLSTSSSAPSNTLKTRKNHVCGRCGLLKTGAGAAINAHSPSWCADFVPCKLRAVAFPQPPGLWNKAHDGTARRYSTFSLARYQSLCRGEVAGLEAKERKAFDHFKGLFGDSTVAPSERTWGKGNCIIFE